MAKPSLLSGIQPSGKLHIGNYLGALRQFVAFQDSGKYDCHFAIVDLHSLTEEFDPKQKSKQILDVAIDFLAAGLDPKKSVIFQQSAVPWHANLAWVFMTLAPMGELDRMTQFKEKGRVRGIELVQELMPKLESHYEKTYELIQMLSDKSNVGSTLEIVESLHKDLILSLKIVKSLVNDSAQRSSNNVGLYVYPVLQTADILLYKPDVVPVGEDQSQHLELTRTLARKFNARFGNTFKEPKTVLTKTPRVMSLDDPTKKMSKSRAAGCLFLDDSPEDIKKKIGRAVTDSGSTIAYDPDSRPGVGNLIRIFSEIFGEPIPSIEKRFKGKGYAEFKSALAGTLADHFEPFRKKKAVLAKSPEKIREILYKGSQKASSRAIETWFEVERKVGIALYPAAPKKRKGRPS